MRLFVFGFMLVVLANCAPAPETSVEILADKEPSRAAVPKQAGDNTSLDEEFPEQQLPEEALSEDDLDIVVIGTFAGESGSAILKVLDNKQATYRVGDEIQSGIYLKAVEQSFIVLEVSGEMKQLPLSNQRLPQDSNETRDFNGNAYNDFRNRLPIKVRADGRVVDRDGDIIGRVNSQGEIIDNSGKIIGRANPN